MKTANSLSEQIFFQSEEMSTDVSAQPLHVINRLLNKEKIIEAAQRSPSGDNCQPWTFKWDMNKLFIYHDDDRARHYLNIKNCASLIGLGCVIESIGLSATEQGYNIQCEYLDMWYNSNQPWAAIQFNPQVTVNRSLLDKELYAYINERYTYRDKFIKSDVQTAILTDKAALIGNLNSNNFFIAQKPPRVFTDYLVKSDLFIWSKLKGIEDLLKWVRFSKAEYEKSKDGMFWKHLSLNVMEKIMLKLLSRNAKSVKYLNAFGFQQILKAKLGMNIKSSSGFICFTVNDKNFSSIIDAGRLAMRCWLYLTQEGFSVQPQTGCSLNAYLAQQNLLPADFTNAERKHFETGNDILKKQFNTNAQPIWLFRYGMPNEIRKETTIRKPISELLKQV